ncbi:MAG: hypothetical protein OEZ58_20570, partial [Gammaproteobacteria bacterium]|nr:hypothetical protein [Gammaproteobacteria bacterium]
MTEQKQPTQFEFTKLYWLQFWPFVLLSLIYIASEFLFNATIVDKVGGDKTDQHTIEFLDYFGRSISAFGLAFIVINLFRMNRLKVAQNISIIFTIILLIVYYFEPINIKIWLTPVLIFGVLSLYSLYRGRPKQSLAFKYVLFTGLFAWFSMFFGQKQIIDYLFIDNSSAEQRLLASKMALFKSGLARDIIRINGLPQRESKPINSPAEKAFLVMIGALLVNSDKAIETISGQEKRIIEKVELDLALEELDQRYKVYLSAGNNLKELYSSYASQSQQYETKRLNFSNQANEHWLDILNQIEQSWHVFLRSKYHTLLLIERDVNKFATDLAKYIEKRNHCINVDNLQCVNQADQQYSKKMNGRFRADHDVSHWCDNRDGGVKYNICQFSESNLRRKLEKQIIDDFEYKKYPITIESFSDYFQHPTTLNHVREELRVGKGIKLSNDWTLDDQSAFTTALVEKSGKKLRKKWDSEWKKKVGGTIEPKLSFEQFVASKTIKNYSKRNLKKANIDNVQYTKTEFYQKIIMPEVREKIVKKYNELKQEGHL